MNDDFKHTATNGVVGVAVGVSGLVTSYLPVVEGALRLLLLLLSVTVTLITLIRLVRGRRGRFSGGSLVPVWIMVSAIVFMLASLAVGCASRTAGIGQTIDGYVCIRRGTGGPGKIGDAELWQRGTNTGSGKPVFLRTLGSTNNFVSSGTYIP